MSFEWSLVGMKSQSEDAVLERLCLRKIWDGLGLVLDLNSDSA